MTEAVVDQRRTVDVLGFANPLNLPANAESATHVAVYGDDVLLTNGVEYELDGVGDIGDLDEIAGVDVIFDNTFLLVAADLYTTFTVEHVPPADQATNLAPGGTLGRLYMAGLDALGRRLQAFKQSFLDRSLRLPVNATDTNVVLPVPEDRRGLVWELDQDTGEYRLVNTYSDPDTEPLTAAEEAAAEAAAAQAAAEAAQLIAEQQAAAAAASAVEAETAAAEAGDLTSLLNFLWPVGGQLAFAGTAAPANFLKENGAAVSRTTYSALFAVIGTTFGAGNGTTTFNLPESRGEFVRGLDDGRGVDVGRTLASAQAAMVGPHTHTATIADGGAHTHTAGPATARYGANGQSYGSWMPSAGDSDRNSVTLTTNSGGSHSHTITINNNTGTETRPRNVARLLCIKY